MAAEIPARMAIIGGGPLGIEAALYARYLGYDVMVFEQGQVGERLSNLGSEPLPSPAGKNRTPLGIAALQAQSGSFQPPDAAKSETAGEYLESYLIPLADSDLLSNSICVQHSVVRIERTELAETAAEQEEPEGTDSDEVEYEIEYAPFLLTIKQADGVEITSLAEIVIDASGLSVKKDAEGERVLNEQIELIPSGLTNPLLAANHPKSRFMTEEPNFYRLGIPDPADANAISLPTGHDQIRQIFTIIGERESLDLYKSFRSR